MSVKSKSLLLLSFTLKFITASAQDEENFPRIARRVIDAYTKTLKSTETYDSTAWHGGMYAATSSRGRIMPNSFLKYKRGKWGIYALAQYLLRSDHTKVLRSQGNTIVTNNDYNARALIMGCSYVF